MLSCVRAVIFLKPRANNKLVNPLTQSTNLNLNPYTPSFPPPLVHSLCSQTLQIVTPSLWFKRRLPLHFKISNVPNANSNTCYPFCNSSTDHVVLSFSGSILCASLNVSFLCNDSTNHVILPSFGRRFPCFSSPWSQVVIMVKQPSSFNSHKIHLYPIGKASFPASSFRYFLFSCASPPCQATTHRGSSIR